MITEVIISPFYREIKDVRFVGLFTTVVKYDIITKKAGDRV